MTEITLYNTRTRRKERLVPLDPGNVRMYVCGPTVYDRAHIGNARAVVVFDTLFRLLRHTYGPEHVTYVRNITDVDDKINARAAATKLPGETELQAIRRITDETTGWYHADMDALGALRPTLEPRATEFIAPMVAMISELIAKGHAYAAEGHVLFSVASDPDYGKLARRSLEDMRAGARVEIAPYKRDPMDFVLWKPSDATTPGWPSPWGYGRPGWHIECSAMAYELLGQSFDIHGGGIDLAFPHHENELAQSRCAHPEGDFARIWMHNEMLNVDGDKMSKSLGNFYTVRDLLDGRAQLALGHLTGPEIRMALLLSHYRDPMDFGVARRHEARALVNEFAQKLGGGGSAYLAELAPAEPLPEVLDALADDLDTNAAIRLLRRRALNDRYGPTGVVERLPNIYASHLLLGLDLRESPAALDSGRDKDNLLGVVERALETVDILHDFGRRIDEARARKNYLVADQIREALLNAGVEVKSTKEGTRLNRLANFDADKLRALQ